MLKKQKIINSSRYNNICINKNENCTYKSSITEIVSRKSSKVHIFSVNWTKNSASFDDLLKFYISMPLYYNIYDVYDRPDGDTDSGDNYVLKAIICQLKGHNLTYIRHKEGTDL